MKNQPEAEDNHQQQPDTGIEGTVKNGVQFGLAGYPVLP